MVGGMKLEASMGIPMPRLAYLNLSFEIIKKRMCTLAETISANKVFLYRQIPCIYKYHEEFTKIGGKAGVFANKILLY